MISPCIKMAVALALATAVGMPQTALPSQNDGLILRSIRIIPVSTSRAGLPDVGAKIQEALANVPLVVESKLNGHALLAAIDKADQAIQSVYNDAGRSVRVEHEVEPIPHRSLEARFRVIELCSCDR